MADLVNEKAIAGRARKAARAEQKREEDAAKEEAEEEVKWQQGAKGWTMSDERKEKAKERLRKKKELGKITAIDEKETPGPLERTARKPDEYPDIGNDRPKVVRIISEPVSYTHLTLPTNREV